MRGQADPDAIGADGRGDASRSALRVLGAVAAILALIVLAGTLFGLATGSRQRALTRESLAELPAGYDIFLLGQVRTRTAGKAGATVAAVISLPYPVDNSALKEELERKAPALRAVATNFFSSKEAFELHPAYEGTIKAGLRDAFNSILSLGSVGEIFLSDFAVLE
jgi:flagellar basal body-associated protein FliL